MNVGGTKHYTLGTEYKTTFSTAPATLDIFNTSEQADTETLVQVLAEEKLNEYSNKNENTPQEYESLLIKLEKEIRGHIQTENQVKLYAETLQNNLEELENENKILKEKLKIEESFNVNTNSNTNTNDVTKDKILELRNEFNWKLKVP